MLVSDRFETEQPAGAARKPPPLKISEKPLIEWEMCVVQVWWYQAPTFVYSEKRAALQRARLEFGHWEVVVAP